MRKSTRLKKLIERLNVWLYCVSCPLITWTEKYTCKRSVAFLGDLVASILHRGMDVWNAGYPGCLVRSEKCRAVTKRGGR